MLTRNSAAQIQAVMDLIEHVTPAFDAAGALCPNAERRNGRARASLHRLSYEGRPRPDHNSRAASGRDRLADIVQQEVDYDIPRRVRPPAVGHAFDGTPV